MNKVILIGRLTKDPELRFTPSGVAVSTVVLAVDRKVFSKEQEKSTDFIQVIIWGKQAESTANYISKGCKFGVCGRIQTRNYNDKDGNKKYVTEVIAEEVSFIEWGNKGEKRPYGMDSGGSNFESDINYGNLPSSDDMTLIDDEDVPF